MLSDSSFRTSTVNVTSSDAQFSEIFGSNVPGKYASNLKVVGGSVTYTTEDPQKLAVLTELGISGGTIAPVQQLTIAEIQTIGEALPTPTGTTFVGIDNDGNEVDMALWHFYWNSDINGWATGDSEDSWPSYAYLETDLDENRNIIGNIPCYIKNATNSGFVKRLNGAFPGDVMGAKRLGGNLELPIGLTDMNEIFDGCIVTLPSNFVIPEGVTSLSMIGFESNVTFPQNFTIPNNVTSMPDTFNSCVVSLPSSFRIPSTVTNISRLFTQNYTSTPLTITLDVPATAIYTDMFAYFGGTITVNYTSRCASIIDSILATAGSSLGVNVIKGNLVD